MNLLGIDVRGLDLEGFFQIAGVVYLLAFAAWLARLWRTQRSGPWGPLALAVLWWGAVNFPLQRLYGLLMPGDRLRNLSWCASAAAGNPPWESGVAGERALEPAWSLLVSLVALRDPGRVMVVYPWLTPLSLTLVALGLWWATREPAEAAPGRLRAMLAVFFVLLACAFPLDPDSHFRDFWSRSFLLKPNHTLGFALVAAVIAVLARPLSWRRTLAAVALFGALTLVFIVHWALLLWCLGCYALLLLWRRRHQELRELGRLAVALALAAAVVAGPYVAFIARGFPHAFTLDRGYAGDPLRSPWGDRAPVSESLLMLASFDLGPLLLLAGIGAFVAWRRGRPTDLLWLSLLLGAYGAWAVTGALFAIGRARAADEVYFFLRFTVMVHAAFGAAALLERLAHSIGAGSSRWAATLGTPTRAAVPFLLCWLPLTVPWWSYPPTMDTHFRLALEPLPAPIDSLAGWLRKNARGSDVVLAGDAVGPWIPALSGRRIWPPPRTAAAAESNLALLRGEDLTQARELLNRSGIRFVTADASLLEQYGLRPGELDSNPLLRRVFETGEVVLYAVRDEPKLPLAESSSS